MGIFTRFWNWLTGVKLAPVTRSEHLNAVGQIGYQRRTRKRLTAEEKKEIWGLYMMGYSVQQIASQLNRPHATIWDHTVGRQNKQFA